MRLKILFLGVFFVSLTFFSLVLFQGLEFENEAMVFIEKEDIPTIVIDPGHGGFDGGAVAEDGTVEKDINLQIALKLQEMLKGYEVNIVMIRDEDESLGQTGGSIKNKKQQDLRLRKKIIEEAGADLTISIHLNSYPEDESVYGAQVFYPKDEQKRTTNKEDEQPSKTYAESVQKAIEFNISDGRERQSMAKDDILLFQNPASPIILVECGFLSNIDECDRLKTAEYQELLAKSICEGINSILDVEKKQKIQIIHSANKTS